MSVSWTYSSASLDARPRCRLHAVTRGDRGRRKATRYCLMLIAETELRRTWLFGPGAAHAHDAMQRSGADALIADLEDFTPPDRRDEARRGLARVLKQWRNAGRIAVVRINALGADGPTDLAAAMPARPDVIAYPMAASAEQMHELHAALSQWESKLGIDPGTTEILPVCETALGVVDVRAIAGGSPRIRAALLGAEDLAADLCAERQPDAIELDHARRRFILECRAAAIEPIDAPYTFSDTEGAVREARYARRLGYRCKALVRPEHAEPINAALTPGDDELRRATAIVVGFETARARGEDRALVDGGWKCRPTEREAAQRACAAPEGSGNSTWPFAPALNPGGISMPKTQTLERFVAMVERNAHADAIESFYAPHASMQENQAPPRIGRDLLIENERRVLLKARSVFSKCVRPILVSDETVVVRWIFEFEWLDGTKTRLEELAYQRWEAERIVEEQFSYDPAQLASRA